MALGMGSLRMAEVTYLEVKQSNIFYIKQMFFNRIINELKIYYAIDIPYLPLNTVNQNFLEMDFRSF